MSERSRPRPDSLASVVGATAQYYADKARTTPGSVGRRQAAYVAKADKILRQLDQELGNLLGISAEEITVFTYPGGNRRLPPVPIAIGGSESFLRRSLPHEAPPPDTQQQPSPDMQQQQSPEIDFQGLAGMPSGRVLAALRREKHLSQQVLGDRIARSKSWVDKVERDVRRLNLGPARDALDALGIPDDDPRRQILLRILEQEARKAHQLRQAERRAFPVNATPGTAFFVPPPRRESSF